MAARTAYHTPTGHQTLLRWWFFFTLISIGAFVLFQTGVMQKINQVDFTRLTFLILAVFSFFTVRTGIKTYRLSKLESISTSLEQHDLEDELGWFISDMLLTLGMIGTVFGFIYMLGTSFQQFDPANAGSLKEAMSRMGAGMSTALYTTAAGLVCSLLLKLQLFNFDHRLARLGAANESQNGSS